MSTSRKRLIAQSMSFGWLAALLLAGWLTVWAQSDNATLAGFVKDAAGAVVANAKVTIKNETRAFERTAMANSEGYFVVTSLPPGLYTVTVEAGGFKTYQETGKKLDAALTTNMDVALQTGQVTETVTIEASTVQLQTETATVGRTVETKQVEYLQLNGRNPLFLAQIKPGVIGGALGGNSFGLTTGGLNINGGRTQDALITYDGAVGVRTRSNGTSIGVADVESTQEVQILTANYNAEYGRASGGQVRIVTRSGGRDFHGAVYEYLRNAAFNANEWGRNRNTPANQPCDNELFEKATHCRPNPFRYNQFGYVASGPVYLPEKIFGPLGGFNEDRSKLFWLWGQEWVRQRRTDNRTIRVATQRMRNGDFSELLNPNNPLQLGVRTLNDPLTGQPFPGNIIPANRLSPNGLALIRTQPEPIPGFFTSTGQNFFQERPTEVNQRKDTLSIDYYPTERHQIKYRLSFYNFVETSAFRGDTDRAPQIIDRPNQTTSINWTWTVSPTWISETLIAGSRDQVFIFVDTRGNSYQRSQYGINYPYIFPEKEIFDKIPTIDGIDQFVAVDGGPYPASSTGPIYQISNNWTNIRGNHTIKFGGYFERAGQNDFDQINVSGTPGGTNNQNGRFVFSNATPGGTGFAIGNAALGLFETYAEIGQRSFTPYRGHMFEWFLQDSWKATPKLRLEYGLRHTIIQPYYSLWRNQVVFDPDLYNPSLAVTQNPANGFITSNPNDLRARYNGLVIPGDGWPDAAKGPGRVGIANTGEFDFLFRDDVPKHFSDIHYNNFQPRIGIAYAFNEKNVIRAGAGRFYTRLGVSDSVFLGGNPPLQPTVSITRGSVDNPGGTAGSVFPLVITTQDKVFKNPEAWTWNAMFEREVGFDTLVEVGYVGRRGLHGQRERNINQLPINTCPANQPGFTGGCAFINPNNTALGRFSPDALRPYKGYGLIRLTNNEANSLYHGLQVSANRRFNDGLLFGAAYTYSKSWDDGSAQRQVVPNAFDVRNLWGPSSYDRRHVLVVNAVYQLPFFKDRSTFAGKVLGGWTISTISQWQTGTPINNSDSGGIATGDDFAGVGPGSGPQYWVINGDATLDRSERKFAVNAGDPNYWFRVNQPGQTCALGSNVAYNPTNCVFTRPAPGTFATQRVRGVVYNPGFQNHNFTLFKEFYVRESHVIQFRAEAYNWPNHPNWNGADATPTSPTFGKVTTKSSQRELQFALRYQF